MLFIATISQLIAVLLLCPIVSYKNFIWHSKLSLSINSNNVQLTDNSKCSVFIFGLGYVGSYLCQELISQGFLVSGTCRNIKKINNFRKQNIKAFLFDETSPMRDHEALEYLYNATHILSTIPPSIETEDDIVLKYYTNEIKSLSTSGKLRWIGYLSSTGVYGDCQGAWIDESCPLNPNNKKTLIRCKADRSWWYMQAKNSLPVNIYRLAGIYGPNRNALDTVCKANGDISLCDGDDINIISRIHVHDVTMFLVAMIKSACDDNLQSISKSTENSGRIVNIADDLPSSRYDALSYACKLLGYEKQKPQSAVELRDEIRPKRNRGGSKRIDNALMHQLLNEVNISSLLFPDYRRGLDTLYNDFYRDSQLHKVNGNVTVDATDDNNGIYNKLNLTENDTVDLTTYNSLIQRIGNLEKTMSKVLRILNFDQIDEST